MRARCVRPDRRRIGLARAVRRNRANHSDDLSNHVRTFIITVKFTGLYTYAVPNWIARIRANIRKRGCVFGKIFGDPSSERRRRAYLADLCTIDFSAVLCPHGGYSVRSRRRYTRENTPHFDINSTRASIAASRVLCQSLPKVADERDKWAR